MRATIGDLNVRHLIQDLGGWYIPAVVVSVLRILHVEAQGLLLSLLQHVQTLNASRHMHRAGKGKWQTRAGAGSSAPF